MDAATVPGQGLPSSEEATESLLGLALQLADALPAQVHLLGDDLQRAGLLAIESVAALRATTVEPVDESLALEAADVSLEHGLAMADAIIYATAARHGAGIVTADADFEGLAGVTLIR